MKKIFLLCFSLLMLASSCAMTKNDAAESHYVLTTDNPVCEISLPANPTTGYTWSALYDKHLVSAQHKYFPAKTRLIGAGGHDVWVFSATEEALGLNKQIYTVVRLVYTRSWEHNVEPAQTKLISITISNK